MPITPAIAPKMKYRVPVYLWLVENSHRVVKLRLFLSFLVREGPERGFFIEMGSLVGLVSKEIPEEFSIHGGEIPVLLGILDPVPQHSFN